LCIATFRGATLRRSPRSRERELNDDHKLKT
jgi:hypothetical protein